MDPETADNSQDHPDQKAARETTTEGKNEWKKRPPYRIHESSEKFDVRYEAQCHCGKVKYQLCREKPLGSKLCHCTTCQTQHGKIALDIFENKVAMAIILSLAFQRHPFNGQLYSTKKTSTSSKGITIWSGTILALSQLSITFRAKSDVHIVIRRLWMKVVT